LMERKVALPHRSYLPFLGTTAEPQGYDSALDGAPLYHCVFPVDDDMDAQHLTEAVAEYEKDTWPSTPSMCLAFRGRGTVCTDDFLHHDGSGYNALTAEIEFIQNLPKMTGDLDLTSWPGMRSFMGKAAGKSYSMRGIVVIYDIDPRLPGRQISEEACQHFLHLREDRKIDKLVLRFPNSGSVMVHRYMEKGRQVLALSTAIQRARKMRLPNEIAAVSA
jgi:hypothetical protein